MNGHQVTKDFEAALCEYTGAKYAVAVNSCTMALLLAVAWHFRDAGHPFPDEREERAVSIPKHTYVGVPMAIRHAGGWPTFRDEDWSGEYQLSPLPVWDAARRFRDGMFHGGFQCVSFHVSKILGLEQGGAILHDNQEADAWFRRARFDGRTEGVSPKDDTFDMLGFHCYMNPSTAALGLFKLSILPKHNADLENSLYSDLSEAPIFRE